MWLSGSSSSSMSRVFPLFLLPFLSLLIQIPTMVQGQTSEKEIRCRFSDPILLSDKDGELYMQYYKNNFDSTYTMRLIFIGEQSWIGIGINSENSNKMSPATSIIGRIEDDGITSSVQYYDLTSDAEDASGVIPFSTSNLSESSTFVQPDDSTSILEFTQDLNEMSIDDGTWIFAVGLPNNEWIGKHKIHGSFDNFQMDDELCIEVTPSPTTSPEPTNLPTTDPTSFPTTERHPTVSPAPTISPQPTGEPSTISPTSVMETLNPTTTLDALMNGNNNGDETSASNSNLVNLVDTTVHPNKQLWIVHGILLAIAWGICAPLAIGVSLLKNTIKQVGGLNWYNWHFYLNISVFLLTLVGFIIAVIATQREDEPHFTTDIHHKLGLSIMCLLFVQVLAGYFRPGTPKPSSSSSLDDNNDPTVDEFLQKSSKTQVSISQHYDNGKNDDGPLPHTPEKASKGNEEDVEESAYAAAAAGTPNTVVLSSPPSLSFDDKIDGDIGDYNHKNNNKATVTTASTATATTKKSMMRIGWEWSHRFLGFALIVMSWYNCQTGIEWQMDNFEEQDITTSNNGYNIWVTIFWSVTMSITGIIFILSYVMKYQ